MSPCVNIYQLDMNNVCIGCNRTLDQIIDWPILTDVERLEIMSKIEE